MQADPLLNNPLLQMQLYPSKVVTHVEFNGHTESVSQLFALENHAKQFTKNLNKFILVEFKF